VPRATLTLFAALLLAGAASAQQVLVRLEEQRTISAVPRVLFPQAEFELVAARPAAMAAIEGLSDEARYALVPFGGRTLHLAFDAPTGALALGLLYTGGDHSVLGTARAGAQGGLLVDFEDVAVDGTHVDVRLQYAGRRVSRAGLQLARHRRGRAAIGGDVREVILVDAEGDGRYDGPDDRWIALKVDRLKEAPGLNRSDMLLLKEPQIPFEPDGRALMVSETAADGSSLVLRLDQPAVTAGEVLRRRYDEVRADFFERFDRERATFAPRNGIDPKRPRVDSPVPWLDVPLSEGRRLAKEQRKPLLVLFFTESNAWGFRYDYYTFPDREVDALLRNFVLVRIDAEKDEEKSYARSGARGLPCLMPLTADGEPISFRLRTYDPATGEAADFRQEERMITGWQRPQDLVTNLKRIQG